MADDFRLFQTYATAEDAQPLLAVLAAHHIEARTNTDNGKLAVDPAFANNERIATFLVKLQVADFEPARRLLDDLNQAAVTQADPGHYLFGFSDTELFDVLTKPDEWSSFDVALASHLLRQRGRDVSADTLALLRQHRVAELARPEESHKAWIALGYFSALLGGAFGLLIGWQLQFHRKTLPDGRRVFAYSDGDRKHGLRILILGMVVLGGIIVLRVL